MGCGLDYLKWLCERCVLKTGDRVLDMGEQCLLAERDEEATREKLRFICSRLGLRNGAFAEENVYEAWITECSWRSALRGHPSVPTLWLGDVLTKCQVEYRALDICSGRYAERFDMLDSLRLFPELRNPGLLNNAPEDCLKAAAPALMLNVIMKKTTEAPFRLNPEVRTAGANLSSTPYTSEFIRRPEGRPINGSLRYFARALRRMLRRIF